jgi:hypothetical protein
MNVQKTLKDVTEKLIEKLINETYKNIEKIDKLILKHYGYNSQIYLNWKDKLNEYSMDPDVK